MPSTKDSYKAHLERLLDAWIAWSAAQGMFPEPELDNFEEAAHAAGKKLGRDMLKELDEAEKRLEQTTKTGLFD